MPWPQYVRKYQRFEEIERFISETSSVSTIFLILYRLCFLEWTTFENAREICQAKSLNPLTKFCQTDFFYFSLFHKEYVYLFVCKLSGHLTKGVLKIITSFIKKNCVANVFSSFQDHWNDMREHLFAGAISTRGKNIHAVMHVRISKIVIFFCFPIQFCAFIFALI